MTPSRSTPALVAILMVSVGAVASAAEPSLRAFAIQNESRVFPLIADRLCCRAMVPPRHPTG